MEAGFEMGAWLVRCLQQCKKAMDKGGGANQKGPRGTSRADMQTSGKTSERPQEAPPLTRSSIPVGNGMDAKGDRVEGSDVGPECWRRGEQVSNEAWQATDWHPPRPVTRPLPPSPEAPSSLLPPPWERASLPRPAGERASLPPPPPPFAPGGLELLATMWAMAQSHSARAL